MDYREYCFFSGGWEGGGAGGGAGGGEIERVWHTIEYRCGAHQGKELTSLQVGAILQTTAYSVPHIMIARFITGIGTGIETSTVPMYQSELCEAKKRGRLVSSEPLFVGVGIEIAYWFDYGMSYTTGSIAWRLPIACQMVFAFVSSRVLFVLEEEEY